MSGSNYMEKLLDGVDVEWKPLGAVTTIKTGQSVNKQMISANLGDYPVINSGREPLGFINIWNTNNDPIGVTTRGAGVGSITWHEGKYYRGNLNYSVTINNNKKISTRYLYHLLLEMQADIQALCTYDGIPALNAGNFKELRIPIPCPENPKKSLEIQAEIVQILDTFTELTAELTARKKQYNYYRDQLLTEVYDSTKEFTIGEIIDMRAGKNIKAKDIAEIETSEHKYTCYGGNGSRGFVSNYSHDGNYVLIGRQGALCGNVKREKGRFYATEHAVACSPKDDVNIDWVFYMLTFMNLNQYKSRSAQPGLAVGNIAKLPIKVPPIEEQTRIVAILDKFDALTNSITEGLPREIELRQKQYEYYRDLLLSFPKPDAEVAA